MKITAKRTTPRIVARDQPELSDDPHCTAVRVSGGHQDRQEIAARYAVEAGLEVWYSPFTCDLTTDELLDSRRHPCTPSGPMMTSA